MAILDVDALPSLAEIRRLGREHPDTRLVLLVTHTTTAECNQALAFGASAYLGRDTQARDVQNAIHLASRDLQLIPRARNDSVARPLQGSQLLTQREAEVLPLLQQGSSNAEIAARLGVGVETIRSHARNIYRKLGVSSRRELTALPSRPSPENADTVAPAYPAPRWATPGRGRQRRPALCAGDRSAAGAGCSPCYDIRPFWPDRLISRATCRYSSQGRRRRGSTPPQMAGFSPIPRFRTIRVSSGRIKETPMSNLAHHAHRFAAIRAARPTRFSRPAVRHAGTALATIASLGLLFAGNASAATAPVGLGTARQLLGPGGFDRHQYRSDHDVR